MVATRDATEAGANTDPRSSGILPACDRAGLGRHAESAREWTNSRPLIVRRMATGFQ